MSRVQDDVIRMLNWPGYCLLQPVSYQDKEAPFYLKGPMYKERVPIPTAKAVIKKMGEALEFSQSTNWKVWKIKPWRPEETELQKPP